MFSKFLSAFATCFFITSLQASDLALALLKKTESFYKKYQSQEINRLEIFNNDDLNQLPADDLAFLQSRLKIYGLAPFKIQGTVMQLSVGQHNLNIDYANIDISALEIKGLPYTFNLKQPLKKLYEVDFKKALKKHKTENSSFFDFLFIPTSHAQAGCQNSSVAANEAAVNSSSIPMAYLRVCAECASIGLNPSGALIGAGLALGQGINAGIQQKSLKACAIEFCKNLPGLGGFINLYNVSTPAKRSSTEHSK